MISKQQNYLIEYNSHKFWFVSGMHVFLHLQALYASGTEFQMSMTWYTFYLYLGRFIHFCLHVVLEESIHSCIDQVDQDLQILPIANK